MQLIEVRNGDATFAGTTARGYAAVFNTWTRIASLYDEKLDPSCFDRTLRENPDVLALWNHAVEAPLGRTTAGTLRLSTDSHGLRFELDLDPRSPTGALALSAVERGDAHGCSFGFWVHGQSWDDNDDWERPRRVMTDLDLIEVSITPMPAYPTTSVSLRSDNADNAASARRRVVAKAEAAMRLRGIVC
ncbi:HK97 family phage prohead protease [Mesorhizobium sp. CO1-1-9]|uniref:HK97 family phage prohead protease n=1 Tax=Mesorhizobium sp. CO1-1-9 TaxID=2876630 RepID=UPI001CCDEF6C|nr:HK97 family phage prohead protease [Mesorhizobium sp. CO1-1-9]MBZ9698820.1 HK97 family phage prohead protease [Mesorhizobium sp. CO1-1-9]